MDKLLDLEEQTKKILSSDILEQKEDELLYIGTPTPKIVGYNEADNGPELSYDMKAVRGASLFTATVWISFQ